MKRFQSQKTYVEILKNCRFLNVQIRLPFEEKLQKEHILQYLTDHSIPTESAFSYEELTEKDTNTGTLHKVLLVFLPADEVDFEKYAETDWLLPEEFYLLEKGNDLVQKGESDFYLCDEIRDRRVIAVFHSGILIHFTVEKFQKEDDLKNRVQFLKEFLESEFEGESFAGEIRTFNFKDLSESDIKQAVEKRLEDSPKLHVNLLPPSLQGKASQKRHLQSIKKIGVFSILAFVLLYGMLWFYHSSQKSKFDKMQASAQLMQQKYQSLDSLKMLLKQKERSFRSAQSIWKSPIQWRIFLDQIAESLPAGSKLKGVQIRKTGVASQVRMTVVLGNWDEVLEFKKSLEKISRLDHVQILNQNRSGKNRILVRLLLGVS